MINPLQKTIHTYVAIKSSVNDTVWTNASSF